MEKHRYFESKGKLFHQSVSTNLLMMKALPVLVAQHHVLHQIQALLFLLQYIHLREDGQHLFVKHQHLHNHLLSSLQT